MSTTTAEDISSIVAKVLNTDKEILINISGMKLASEMNIADSNDDGISRVTFQESDQENESKNHYPTSETGSKVLPIGTLKIFNKTPNRSSSSSRITTLSI